MDGQVDAAVPGQDVDGSHGGLFVGGGGGGGGLRRLSLLLFFNLVLLLALKRGHVRMVVRLLKVVQALGELVRPGAAATGHRRVQGLPLKFNTYL